MARFNECCCRFRCVRLHKQFQSSEKTKLQGIFLLANTAKISYCTPWGFYGNLHYLNRIVFSMKKQLFLQSQSHLPLWNSAESSKSDSNTLLSNPPAPSPWASVLQWQLLVEGRKQVNSLIVNRLFFTTWGMQHFSTTAQLGRPSCTLVKIIGGTARFSITIIITYWYYTAPKCYQLRAKPQYTSCSYTCRGKTVPSLGTFSPGPRADTVTVTD